jgi:hypothetical protein
MFLLRRDQAWYVVQQPCAAGVSPGDHLGSVSRAGECERAMYGREIVKRKGGAMRLGKNGFKWRRKCVCVSMCVGGGEVGGFVCVCVCVCVCGGGGHVCLYVSRCVQWYGCEEWRY